MQIADESPTLYAEPVHFSIPIPSITTTVFIQRGAIGHTQEPPVKTSSTQNLPNSKISIRLVQAPPAPQLIWLPPAVQARETHMAAPAPATPKRRSVTPRHQDLIYIIMLALEVAIVSCWKSHRSSHQTPPLLRTPLIQNSSLPLSLPVDNVPPRITVTWWLLVSSLSPLRLSCPVDLSYIWLLSFYCLLCALAPSYILEHLFSREPCKEWKRR